MDYFLEKFKSLKVLSIEANSDIERVTDMLEMIAIARTNSSTNKYKWIAEKLENIETHSIYGENDIEIEVVSKSMTLVLTD